jgi:hypothetical protein
MHLFQYQINLHNTMTMPVPSYEDSKEDLIKALRSSGGSGTRQYDIAKAILDIKNQEEVARQTKNLMIATLILAFATLGVVFATIALVVVSSHQPMTALRQ